MCVHICRSFCVSVCVYVSRRWYIFQLIYIIFLCECSINFLWIIDYHSFECMNHSNSLIFSLNGSFFCYTPGRVYAENAFRGQTKTKMVFRLLVGEKPVFAIVQTHFEASKSIDIFILEYWMCVRAYMTAKQLVSVLVFRDSNGLYSINPLFGLCFRRLQCAWHGFGSDNINVDENQWNSTFWTYYLTTISIFETKL